MPDNVKPHVAAPRFYIAFFQAEAETRVFVRVKGVPGISLKSPKGQGYEEEAFTVMNGEDRDTSCDEANKAIEDWSAPRLAGLTPTLLPTDEQCLLGKQGFDVWMRTGIGAGDVLDPVASEAGVVESRFTDLANPFLRDLHPAR